MHLSLIYVVQNLFCQSKNYRTISLNSTCHVIFKNPRDCRQISYISNQICPWNPKFISESFYDATREPFTYLFLDFDPSTPDDLRVRGNIFDMNPVVYIENKNGIKG